MKFARLSLFSASAVAAVLAIGAPGGAQAHTIQVTNLVSDGFVPAPTVDPNLVNPWGLASGPTSPIWVNDNGPGVTTLYSGSTKIPLTVKDFPHNGTAAVTGQVFNTGGSSSFMVHNGAGATGRAVFLMAGENGDISGWAPSLNLNNTFLGVGNAGGGDLVHAVYKGLAIGTNAMGDALYATNFRAGDVEVYNSSFGLEGTFTDPTVAPGYAPFGIQTIGGNLFVSFGLQDSIKHDEQDGVGLGYIDEFDMNGNLLMRIASAGNSQVNAPWGFAIAPASFGPKFAGDLLVGQFGDGTINAYNLTTNTFVGKLRGPGGVPITLDGLWGLLAGNGGAGGSPNSIFFSAGLNGENDGLFGSLSAVPEPGTWTSMILGFGLVGLMMRRHRSRLNPA
jgi:uncharacterized protein (TIGR03118 family)